MIELIEKQILGFVQELNSSSIEEKIQKIPSGKRVRAKLVLKIAGVNEQSIKLGAIIELIHTASLLHDDVIDDANKRRGSESINAMYGDKTAIMLGDILYSKAFYELSSFSSEIAQTVSNAVTLLSLGELEDVELSNIFNEDEEKYNSMIYKKTASLIEATCKASAILSKKDAEAYAKYGKNLGLAFQIVDDILDITSSSQVLGKPVMSDYQEGKTTLPFIFCYQKSSPEDKKTLKSLFKTKLTQDESLWIQKQLNKMQAIAYSKKVVEQLSQEAINSVSDAELILIVENMKNREF